MFSLCSSWSYTQDLSGSFISIHHHLNRYQAPIWNIPLLLCNIICCWSTVSFHPHAWVFHSCKSCRRDGLPAPASPGAFKSKYNCVLKQLWLVFAVSHCKVSESCLLNYSLWDTSCAFILLYLLRILTHQQVGGNVLLWHSRCDLESLFLDLFKNLFSCLLWF